MVKTKIFYVTLFLIVGLFLAWQITAYKAPEPDYHVLKNDGDITIREYPSLILAEVQISGERYTAINKGFKILANYIFGNNNDSKKINMTAPVIQKSIKIPMTAPVLQQSINQNWIVRFIMPAKFTLKTLPKPNNKAVSLVNIPPKKYVVIRFSGRNSKNNLEMHLKKIESYIAHNKLNVVGEPTYAFYNPPWILPFLRRNEIMIELK